MKKYGGRVLFLLVLQFLYLTCGTNIKENKISIPERLKRFVTCGVKKQTITYKAEGCDDKDIEVSYCDGKCVSYTKYKNVYPYFEMECSCCKASTMTIQAVQMKCGDVTKVKVVDNVGLCECRRCVDDGDLRTN